MQFLASESIPLNFYGVANDEDFTFWEYIPQAVLTCKPLVCFDCICSVLATAKSCEQRLSKQSGDEVFGIAVFHEAWEGQFLLHDITARTLCQYTPNQRFYNSLTDK